MKHQTLGHLNFLELASITGVALGLPAMVIGGQLAKQYGAGAALIAIFVGNFVLWLIGLGIITMAQKGDAIENVETHLGKKSAVFAALILVLAFIVWYALQVEGVAVATDTLLPTYTQLEVGIALGLLVAFLSLGGLRLIKWVCIIGLPLLLLFAIYASFVAKQPVVFAGTWKLSFPAILSVVLLWLAGIVNLPTFFRFSPSRPDSVLALSLMTIFHMLFQIFTILIGLDVPAAIATLAGKIPTILLLAFALLAYLCINLPNIYFASAGWSMIFPQHRDGKLSLLIVGLLGTVVYALVEPHFPLEFLRIAVTGFITSLGVVLIIDMLVRIAATHRPKRLENVMSSVCWLAGCVATLIVQFLYPSNDTMAIVAGISASSVAFLVFIFIEETLWSIKKLAD